MNKFMETFSDFRKTLLLSLAIHLLLLLMFLIISVGMDFSPADFAEVSFVSSARGSLPRTPVRTRAEIVPPKPRPQREQAPSSQTTQPKAEPVNLPKRRMLEDEEPQLTQRQTGKLTPTQDQTRIVPSEDVYESRQVGRDIEGTRVSEPTPIPSGEQAGGEPEAPPTKDIGVAGSKQPYTIEGDAARRTILNQVLPQYPPGYQKEAVVKIRFTVLPDGSVGPMIPVQKGDPELEEITMRVLRQWRFNPLPPGVEQKSVQGVITFRYQLQ